MSLCPSVRLRERVRTDERTSLLLRSCNTVRPGTGERGRTDGTLLSVRPDPLPIADGRTNTSAPLVNALTHSILTTSMED